METQDALTDVLGLRVGHASRSGERWPGWQTGTTVVLPPPEGAVTAVDSRGGAPGTRETDALDPRNAVERIHAVVLTGGSAFGLEAASGAMDWLEQQGRGVPVGLDPAQVVPVVPAAVLFDLGRGGRWRARPDSALGREATEAAARTEPGDPVLQGNVGAGTGAVAGGLKGGIGSASTELASGTRVGVLAAVNAAGSPLDPISGALYGELYGQLCGQSYGELSRKPAGTLPGAASSVSSASFVSSAPSPAVHEQAQRRLSEARRETATRAAGALRPPFNTTLAVVATDAELTRAQAQKLAGTAHDGLARAVRPVHLMHDGDTVFAMATGQRPLAEQELNDVLAAGADVLTRAVVKAVLAAQTVDGPGGVFPSYRDLYGRTS